MDRRDQLVDLLAALYAAPGTLEGWEAFLLALCRTIDGSAAHFVSYDISTRRGSVAVTARTDPVAIRDYTAHWAAEDPWAIAFAERVLNRRLPADRRIAVGTIFLGHDLISRDAFGRTAFLNDFSHQYDIFQCIGGYLEVGSDVLSAVSINGGRRRALFGRDEALFVQALVPHVQRALQVHRRLASAEDVAEASTEVLDRLTHGVFFIDARGRVIRANRAAAELLRAHDGLAIDRGELRASGPADTQRLRQAIAAATEATTNGGLEPGGVVTLGRPSGRRALTAIVAPGARRPSVVGQDPPAALVFVADPEPIHAPMPEQLQARFGLTAAEARVAVALLDGDPPEQVGNRLCVSRNTIRTHLQRIFEKTNTKRQGELIRLLLALRPPAEEQ